MTKTYAECGQAVDAEIKRAMDGWTDDKEFFSNRMIGFLRAKVVTLTYENELLRDQSNTREMHALLERLQGDTYERQQAGDATNFGKAE